MAEVRETEGKGRSIADVYHFFKIMSDDTNKYMNTKFNELNKRLIQRTN